MTRPKKNRSVRVPPRFNAFKPAGVPMRGLPVNNLSLDEFEAIRLADLLGLDQAEASDRMDISRPTFTRLIARARRKLADFLVNGSNLVIEGGSIHFRINLIHCLDCGLYFENPLDSPLNTVCPECRGPHLEDLADRFGHGPCCIPISEPAPGPGKPGRGGRGSGRGNRGSRNQGGNRGRGGR